MKKPIEILMLTVTIALLIISGCKKIDKFLNPVRVAQEETAARLDKELAEAERRREAAEAKMQDSMNDYSNKIESQRKNLRNLSMAHDLLVRDYDKTTCVMKSPTIFESDADGLSTSEKNGLRLIYNEFLSDEQKAAVGAHKFKPDCAEYLELVREIGNYISFEEARLQRM